MGKKQYSLTPSLGEAILCKRVSYDICMNSQLISPIIIKWALK